MTRRSIKQNWPGGPSGFYVWTIPLIVFILLRVLTSDTWALVAQDLVIAWVVVTVIVAVYVRFRR